jgi:hypothetical protein
VSVAVDLPPELAPALRERVEQLLAECPPATKPTITHARGRDLRPPCYVCRRTTGRMGGHHVRPGDDTSVVPVHRSCHRKLHTDKRECS